MPLETDMEIDVLVIGAGGCGLVAALAAHAGGAEVAIVEKAPRLGGNTAVSSGSIPAAGTKLQAAAGVLDSPETFQADLARVAGQHEAMHLTEALTRRSSDLIDFLIEDAKCRITLVTAYKHVGHSVTRLHAPPSRKGIDLMEDLERAVEARGIALALGQPAVSLLEEDGKVCGAVIDDGAGGTYTIGAKAVILATNGFGAARDLIAELCPLAQNAAYGGSQQSEGEAIRWGRALGAGLANISAFQGHAALDANSGGLMTWTTVERGAVIINAKGERFMDESIGYSAAAARQMADIGPFYMIYDDRIMENVAAGQPEFAEAVELGAARAATSVEELAAKTGTEAQMLAQTLAASQAAAAGTGADPMGRTAWGFGALDLTRLRYTEIKPALFHTQGGLTVNTEGQVLREDGSVIAGLYAGGGAAAGISGQAGSTGYMSGNGLLGALGLGLIAGEAAAAQLRK